MLSVEPRKEPTIVTEVGTGTREAILQKTVQVLPVITFEMPLSSLADYILAYCIGGESTPQGDLTSHTLRAYDGAESHEWTDCLVNTCRVNIPTPEGGSIKANIEVRPKDWDNSTDLSSVTWSKSTLTPMTRTNVSSLMIGTTTFTGYFIDAFFNINNNVVQLVHGTSIKPSEVKDRHVAYNGQIRVSRTGTSRFTDTFAGSQRDVVYSLTDNAGSPVTKTLTFKSCSLGPTRIGIRGLDPSVETIAWQSNTLVVS